ncbi:MAG: SPASM domain-containing protein, partial [Lachnospiraceae bacterium]|nr:SPASM domain-containing protein [Lachnospiraceae bacterium]
CERLMKAGVKPDLLCTVTMETAKNADAVYRGLKNLHTGWIQFIPILVRVGLSEGEKPAISHAEGHTECAADRFPEPEMTPESVTPEAYGKFLCAVFDEWISHDLGKTGVQFFMETLSLLSGRPSSLCMLQKQCGRVLVVEHDGSVYSCDHFVDKAHFLGNIHEKTLSEMADSAFQEQFGKDKEESLPGRCRNCRYLSLCRGNCPKDRFSPDGSYYLCKGLKSFYDHAVPMLQKVLEMNRKKVPAGTIMASMRSELKKKRIRC